MMEAELDEHLGYDEYERSDNPDYRNGVKHKKLRSSYGEIPIDVPQDRNTFYILHLKYLISIKFLQ